MLAPILAFTADEAWEFVPKGSGSIHQSEWKAGPFTLDSEELARWDWLKLWREQILPALEKARQEKKIGKALDAQVQIRIPPDQGNCADGELLRELVNVSALKITVGEPASISVSKADGEKCERCWHWETSVGSNPEHPTICAPCVEAVKQAKATS
jgi:isoleucyl-tRNA synthetase